MNVDDYLIPHDGLDFDAIFEDWKAIIPSRFAVWLINKFGGVFLVLPDDSVEHLDVGAGVIRKVADSCDQFCELIDKEENAVAWLLIPLVDALVEAGKTLGKNECYGFKLPPILGGEYSVENACVCDIGVHYSLLGQIATQAKDLPEGTRIREIRIED